MYFSHTNLGSREIQTTGEIRNAESEKCCMDNLSTPNNLERMQLHKIKETYFILSMGKLLIYMQNQLLFAQTLRTRGITSASHCLLHINKTVTPCPPHVSSGSSGARDMSFPFQPQTQKARKIQTTGLRDGGIRLLSLTIFRLAPLVCPLQLWSGDHCHGHRSRWFASWGSSAPWALSS